MSLASCKQWAAEHGLTVLVKKHNASEYTWAVRLDDTATIDWGRATSEAHAWAAMWGAIGSLSAYYLTRAEHLRALTPIHQAPASPEATDALVLNTVRELAATGRTVRVTDIRARTGIGPIAIWQPLNRLQDAGLIHIPITGDDTVTLTKTPPERQLSLEGDPA